MKLFIYVDLPKILFFSLSVDNYDLNASLDGVVVSQDD